MDKPMYSVPLMNAVRQCAEGNGLVLCEVISGLMMTPRQLRRIAEVPVRQGQVWRHVVTDRSYSIVAVAIEEATLTPVVVYMGCVDGVTWTRPMAEFLGMKNGRPRFELLRGSEVP